MATCDFETWSLCESTLEFAALDVLSPPDNLALFNSELAAEQLDAGAKRFERLKRDSLVKAGEASKAWAEASDQLADAKDKWLVCRKALVDVWHKKQADEKAASQEAE